MAGWISAQGATVTWIGGSGDWNTVTNWSTGALPGTGDDVVIGSGPAITVTYSSGSQVVNSIQSQQAFVLSGGVLTVSSTFQGSNALTLSGGTLVADRVSAAALTLDRAALIATNIQASSLLVTNSGLITTFSPTATQVYPLVVFVTNAVNVSANSRIDVTGLGYLPGYTTGNTTVGGATGDSGGSYGGLGHNGFFYSGTTANAVYGDYANPDDWGSGGGINSSGGGLVRLVAGSLFLEGQVLADGQNQVSWPGNYSGGSGGGIYVSVGTLAGAGQIRASGATDNSENITGPSGDGGGGRVAVYAQDYSAFNLANITAPGGDASPRSSGGGGTVYIQGATQGFLVINGGGASGVTPLGLPGSNTFAVLVPVIIEGSADGGAV